jgi:hypothetical protein
MQVRLLPVVVLVVALAVTGCGSPREEGGAAGGGPSGGSVRGSPGADTPVGSALRKCAKDRAAGGFGPCQPPKPKFKRVEPTPGMVEPRPVRWQAAAIVDGDTVLIRYYSGVPPCSVLDHVDVSYGDEEVAITLYEGAEPGSDDVACPELAMAKEVTVDLDQPVGGRKIVDGAGG